LLNFGAEWRPTNCRGLSGFDDKRLRSSTAIGIDSLHGAASRTNATMMHITSASFS
jgi:hypothetical protein